MSFFVSNINIKLLDFSNEILFHPLGQRATKMPVLEVCFNLQNRGDIESSLYSRHCTLLQDNREEGAKCSGPLRAKSLRFPIS